MLGQGSKIQVRNLVVEAFKDMVNSSNKVAPVMEEITKADGEAKVDVVAVNLQESDIIVRKLVTRSKTAVRKREMKVEKQQP
jgi:hypothetical protein